MVLPTKIHILRETKGPNSAGWSLLPVAVRECFDVCGGGGLKELKAVRILPFTQSRTPTGAPTAKPDIPWQKVCSQVDTMACPGQGGVRMCEVGGQGWW